MNFKVHYDCGNCRGYEDMLTFETIRIFFPNFWDRRSNAIDLAVDIVFSRKLP